MKSNKKYSLKPGRHQFAPGSAAAHSGNDLSDAEVEWYIQRYPHIKTLFITAPENQPADEQLKAPTRDDDAELLSSKPRSVKSK